MKKLLSIFLTILMIAAMSVSVAATGSPVNAIWLEHVNDSVGAFAYITKGSDIIPLTEADLVLSMNVDQGVKDRLNEEKLMMTLAAMNVNMKYDSKNLKAEEFFDVSLATEANKAVLNEKKTEITLRIGYSKLGDPDVNPVIMHYPSAEEGWKLVQQKNVENNGDNTLTVTMDSLCPIVLLSVAADDGSAGVHGISLTEVLAGIAIIAVPLLLLAWIWLIIVGSVSRSRKRKLRKLKRAQKKAKKEEDTTERFVEKEEKREEKKAEKQEEPKAEEAVQPAPVAQKAAPKTEKKVVKKVVRASSKGGRFTPKDMLAANIFALGTLIAAKAVLSNKPKKKGQCPFQPKKKK